MYKIYGLSGLISVLIATLVFIFLKNSSIFFIIFVVIINLYVLVNTSIFCLKDKQLYVYKFPFTKKKLFNTDEVSVKLIENRALGGIHSIEITKKNETDIFVFKLSSSSYFLTRISNALNAVTEYK